MKEIELYPPGSEQAAIHWSGQQHWGKKEVELYKSGPKKGTPRDVTGPGCTQCTRCSSRQGEAINAPIRFDGDPSKGRLLVVLSYLGYGDSVEWMVARIRALGFEGHIYCDLSIRCGTGDVSDSHLNHCRPYLSFTAHSVKPTHILTCGANASKALLGKTVMTYQNRMNWQMIDHLGQRIPVVSTVEPDIAQTNKFYEQFFLDEVRALLTHDWASEPPMSGTAYVCETSADFDLFVAWATAPGADFISYDCETSGELFTSGFRVVSIGFSRPDCDDVFVFVDAIKNPLALDAIRQVLTGSMPKSGQNLRYDLQSIWTAFGWEVTPIYGDVRIEYKQVNSDGVANLQALGQMLGIGQHKREAEEALEVIREKLRKEERERLGVKKLPSSYRVDAYAYGHLLHDINARYVGRDAQTTAKTHVWVRKQLDLLPELKATYNRVVLPAISELMLVERAGMGIDPTMVSMCSNFFETELADLETKLSAHGIDPDDSKTIMAFFEEKGIWSDKWEKTKTGKLSLDARALNLVKKQHSAVADILEYRKLNKLLQSYVATLPSHVRDDGRVHPSILLGSVRSGRLSMNDPAMQTIPSRGGDAATMVKSIFVASPGNTYVCADYKTLEIYLTAILSEDPIMIASLASGLDYHLETAKKIAKQAWGMTPEQVEAEYLAGDKYRRRIGKTLNFACIAEGQLVLTNRGLVAIERVRSHDLVWDGVEWVSHDGVVYMGDRDVITYQGLTATPDHNVWTSRGDKLPLGTAASEGHALARADDGAEWKEPTQPAQKVRVYDILNAGPRHRFTCSGVLVSNCLYGQGPEAVSESVGCTQAAAKTLLDSLFAAYPKLREWIAKCKAEARATGYTYAYWDGAPSRRRPVFDAGFSDSKRRGHAERAAFNNRVQSSASDYCLMSVVALNKFFRANKWPARVVLTVHDSIIVECRQDLVHQVAAKMTEVMTSWPSGPLQLVVEIEHGPVWGGVQELVL